MPASYPDEFTVARPKDARILRLDWGRVLADLRDTLEADVRTGAAEDRD